MEPAAVFALPAVDGLSVERLTPDDAERLQVLYEACTDFALLVDGEPPAPQAAAEELVGLPPGARPEDKHVFGLVEPSGRIVAMIESVRGFPEPGTWWLGLMMVDPALRRGGVGTGFYSAFERWVLTQAGQQIQLGVVSANATGLAFWRSRGFVQLRVVAGQRFGRLTHDIHVLGKAIV